MTAGRRNSGIRSQDWCTPPKYVEAIRDFFNGPARLDPCSNDRSTVGAETEYRLPYMNGLEASWNFRTIYVNPPYGRDRDRGTGISDWLERCARARNEHGAEILALVPVATNTGHWKKFVFGEASAISFLADTRLRFVGEEGDAGAPMACAMIYWGDRYDRFAATFRSYGSVVDIRPLQESRNEH